MWILYVILSNRHIPHKLKYIILIAVFLFFNKIIIIMTNLLSWIVKVNLGYCRDIETKKLAKTILMENLNFKQIGKFPSIPTIYVANYPNTMLEYLAMRLIPGDVCGVAFNSMVGRLIRFSGKEDKFMIIKKGNSFETLKEKIKEKINTMSVFAYVENVHAKYSKEYDVPIGLPLRTGIIKIAKQLNIPITPIFVSRIKYDKANITTKDFKIAVGETSHVDDVKKTLHKIKKFFTHHL